MAAVVIVIARIVIIIVFLVRVKLVGTRVLATIMTLAFTLLATIPAFRFLSSGVGIVGGVGGGRIIFDFQII